MIISGARARRLIGATFALLAAMGSAALHAETLRIGGTGAGLGTMSLLAAQFAKAVPVTVVVVPNLGTSGGLKALAEGAIDLALSSRPPTAHESQHGIVATEYGRTPFVIITPRKRAAGPRNLDELVDIYAGRTTTWGDGEPIRLVLRPAQDGDSALLASFSPEMKLAVERALNKPGMIVASSDQEAADAVERTPGAIGTASLALIRTEQRQLNVLPLDGVRPSPKALEDGTYPYFKAMYVARKSGGKKAAARFVEFMSSVPARQILIDSGHWVLNANMGR